MHSFLKVNQVPPLLLGRILLQLHTIPHNDQSDLLTLIATGLQYYGHTSDLNAFLNYCQAATRKEEWTWGYYEIENQSDWDKANYKKEYQLVGLRFFLASELARKDIQLIRHSKNILLGQRFAYSYHETFIPLNQLLQDTKTYFAQQQCPTPESTVLQQLLDLRLERFSEDMNKFEQESASLDNDEYHLMGALMVNYNNACCLYLRDYAETPEGLTWRIFGFDEEKRITCEQAIIDIRGTGEYEPSSFSINYRPIYVFYGNQELLTTPLQEQPENAHEVSDENPISWEDYTLEEDYTTQNPTEEENAICIHCGITDIVEDVNDIFICESCENGVHQLCEDPPIQEYEKDIDPWYCRACCRSKNLPIPLQLSPSKRRRTGSLSEEGNRIIK